MIGSRYEETRVNLCFKIRENLINISEELDEGLCYLCKRKIEKGYIVKDIQEVLGNQSEVKFPIHKECYELSKSYIFYLNTILGIN